MGVECLRLLNEIIADFDEVPEPFLSFLVLCLPGDEHEPLGGLRLCVMACVHLLQLMDKECYKDIEKIKTIGSTYMAAVGLVPTIGTKVEVFMLFLSLFYELNNLNVQLASVLQVKKSVYDHLSTIADYAIEMFDVLDEINYQSYNEFVLRVGASAHALELVPPADPPMSCTVTSFPV